MMVRLNIPDMMNSMEFLLSKIVLASDSNDAGPNKFSQPIRNNELSTDCFLPVESTDSFPHDLALDTGGVTIPAHHSDEAQFPMFENE